MIAYLIKTVACSAVFLLVYLLFLEREKMHRFNRWYLLGSILLSFIIPLVSIPVSQELLPALDDTYIINWEPGNITATQAAPTITGPSTGQITEPSAGLKIPVWILLYGSITLLLFIRFCKNLYRLAAATWNRQIIRYNDISLIVVKGDISSYTFFNTIFISEVDYPANGGESAILTHELAHVRQKHSWDVLFIELVKVFCWFNPLFIFYKKAIQLNHEFLADEAVINDHPDIHAYQHLLLNQISRSSSLSLTSSFNYSITKKRLVMMIKQQNLLASTWKKIMVLPILALVAFTFCSKQITANTATLFPGKVAADDSKSITAQKDTVKSGLVRIHPWDPPVTAEGISQTEMNTYNSIVNAGLEKKGHEVTMHISSEQREKLLSIYLKMNKEQRFNARIGFMTKTDPPKKKIPTEAQLQKWKNPADYGIWIDGKKINNDQLNQYKPSDFSYYDASNLAYTEQMKKDVMTRFNLKVMYKVQLNLETNKSYEDWVSRTEALPLYGMYYHTTYDSTRSRPVEGRYMVNEDIRTR